MLDCDRCHWFDKYNPVTTTKELISPKNKSPALKQSANMKNPHTRKDKKALSPEIIKAFHETGRNRDLNAFKRLLGQYASHILR